MVSNTLKKPSTRLTTLFNEKDFRQTLAESKDVLASFRQQLTHGRTLLQQWHKAGIAAPKIISAHAWLIDQLLVSAWDHLAQDKQDNHDKALIAVGGYGRGELHPYSDIDLMILLPEHDSESHHSSVERFLQFLWKSRDEQFLAHPVHAPHVENLTLACDPACNAARPAHLDCLLPVNRLAVLRQPLAGREERLHRPFGR